MKKLRTQIIASTHLDRTGDQISKDDLECFFNQIPAELKLNEEHDLSKPVVAKGYNKKFVSQPDGNYAITMDIEVFDEEIFKNMGGISISFTTGRITINKDKKGDIEVLFNNAIFDKEDIKYLVNLSNKEVQIDGLELVQKYLEPIGILIIAFVGIPFFKGFFGKAGSDLYDSMKKKIREISKKQKKEKKTEIYIHCKINLNIDNKIIELIIPFKSDQLDIVDKHGINLDHIIEDIKNNAELYKTQRITAKIVDKPPYWEITQLS